MTLCGALGALFLKTGAVRITGIRSVFTTPKIWLGGCFYLAGALMNIALLHHYAYSIVYPLTAITYVWSLIFLRCCSMNASPWKNVSGSRRFVSVPFCWCNSRFIRGFAGCSACQKRAVL